MNTIRRKVRIRNPIGLNLRMASELASIACSSDYSIRIHNAMGSADPVSIFELMILGVATGDWVAVSVAEQSAAEVLDGICDFLTTYEDVSVVHLEVESSDTGSYAA